MKLIYRATPIDAAHGDQTTRSWRDQIDYSLSHADDAIVFRPEEAFRVHQTHYEIDPRIEVINRAALEQADGVIALMPPRVLSLGVGREVEAARSLGIPVLILSEKRTWSAHDCDWAELGPRTGPFVTEWVNGLPARTPGLEAAGNLLVAPDEGCEDLIPTRSHAGDAGFDLFVAQETFVGYDEFVDVSCGIRIALPPGTWGRITGRSSTLRRRGLLVADGVIDNGYRGPIFAGVRNMTQHGVRLMRGDRIAQLIFHSLITPRYTPLQIAGAEFELIPHDGRGDAGFGSTGV